ncbi:MAG: 4-(cytidine 5'-diphospho)-2-C-methyl-D-erythritol kinase [Microscillaceae bacterium]|nr:4-(cytidine 5'-diphospho)-2-C-methyl-D-erythritol kinase [Microscillaceae bacterium]MDW8459886.1 4-(cytidine 5'-diphospho)-2-C-methyl-D-erythritol kinase [Cytophagales bacterium]
MVTFPNAKINIGLQILRKRPDGYHDLASCFYPVACHDILEILPAQMPEFQTSGIPIPQDGKPNICQRAYQLLAQDFRLPPVYMHLYKNLPIGAGLGGGSADAAFTLKMLNEIFELHLPVEKLQNYARQLGSDCAFFIENQPKYCTQKGDHFQDITLSLKGKQIVIIYPNLHISTAEAYQNIIPNDKVTPLYQLLQQPIHTWKDCITNDFESPLFAKYPLLAQIKQTLYANHAIYASLTGSGSAIFGIFEKQNFTSLKRLFPTHYWIWEGEMEV